MRGNKGMEEEEKKGRERKGRGGRKGKEQKERDGKEREGKG